MRGFAIILVLGLSGARPLWSQWEAEISSPGASEQLRLGVTAFHQGRLAESTLLFEKALAYDPNSPIVKTWLGRAYYRSGFEATALTAWESVLADPGAPAELRSMVDSLRARRSIDAEGGAPAYLEAMLFEGRAGRTPSFPRPSSLAAVPDGGFYVVSQALGQVLRMDGNGVLKARVSGGLQGLDRPFGVAVAPDGTLYIAEFNGDRISSTGPGGTRTFGSRGRGDGQLLGPQYLALDGHGYLYVTDFGNARVSKFDDQGKFILSFGKASGDFPGFRSPTGILCIDGEILVADALAKSVYRFDESGNYEGILVDGGLHFPEGMSAWNNGRKVLLADTDRLLSIDLDSEAVAELYRPAGGKPRLTSAVADYNGNILAADFDASTVVVLSEASSLVQGLRVEISRIDASAFPMVRLFVDVQDRLGHPVVGLSGSNFYLSELHHSLSSQRQGEATVTKTVTSIVPARKVLFEGGGSNSRTWRTVFLVERSASMAALSAAVRQGLADIIGTMGQEGRLGAVVAARTPQTLAKVGAAPDLASIMSGLRAAAGEPGRLDLGIRQSVNELLPTESRDSIVYVGRGPLDNTALSTVAISEIAALLVNNDIRFHVLVYGDLALDPVLDYLVRRSGGTIVRASDPKGAAAILPALAQGPSGRYGFSFVSGDDDAFGERMLTASVEAWLFQKSGRDSLGYYAPIR